MNVDDSELLSSSWSKEDAPVESQQASRSSLPLFSKFFPDLDSSTIRTMWSLFWPIFVALLFQYSSNMVSVAFCGHLGEDQLGSVGLANSVITVTGIAIIAGIAGAGDTLGAQAYGAKNYHKVGIIFQKGVVILGLACFPIWAFWVNIDKILILVKQPEVVAEGTWLYLMVFSPGLIAMVLVRLLRSYLQVQGVVKPVAVTCFISFIVNIVSNYVLIYALKLGLLGAAITTNLTYLCMFITLAIYTYVSKVYLLTWTKPSKACLTEWKSYVKLGFSGMAGELLLFSGNEITIFLMGILGKTELGAQVILFQVQTVLAMISIGISITMCILTGREVGAGNPRRAQQVGKLGISISLVINCILSLILFACKDKIGAIFSKDKAVLLQISSALPYMIISLVTFSENNVLAGILLGCAKQKVFTLLFFIGSYVIGLPLGIVLTFVRHMGIVGMWVGMATGMFVQLVLSVIYIFCMIDYTMTSETARQQATANKMPETYGSFSCSNDHKESEMIVLQGGESEVQNKSMPNNELIKENILYKRGLILAFCIIILLVGILIKVL